MTPELSGKGLDSNYCRNPDVSETSPWCYTTDGARYELCTQIPPCLSPPSLPPPPTLISPKQFTLEVLMEVDGSAAAAGITVAQLIATAESLVAADASASVEVSVTQLWVVVYEMGGSASETATAVKLAEACQAISPSCTASAAGVSSRRRALESGSTGMVTLSRSLSDGNITGNISEIPQLEVSGVSVTSSTFNSVKALLSVTKQGGAEEASALREGSLSPANVTSAVSESLGLDEDTLSVLVQQPIFPPMQPPPSAPPSPPPPAPPSPLSPPLSPPPSPPLQPPATPLPSPPSSPPPSPPLQPPAPPPAPPASPASPSAEPDANAGSSNSAGTVVGSMIVVMLFLGLVTAAVRWYRRGHSPRTSHLMPRMSHEIEFESFKPLSAL